MESFSGSLQIPAHITEKKEYVLARFQRFIVTISIQVSLQFYRHVFSTSKENKPIAVSFKLVSFRISTTLAVPPYPIQFAHINFLNPENLFCFELHLCAKSVSTFIKVLQSELQNFFYKVFFVRVIIIWLVDETNWHTW